MIRALLEKVGLITRQPCPFERLSERGQARFNRVLYRKDRKPPFWK